MLKHLTHQKIRILLELSALKSIRRVAEIEHRSPSVISSHRLDALMCMRCSAGQNTIIKSGAELIRCMAGDKYNEYYRELEGYIRDGFSNEGRKKYWERIPCKGKLTPEELMDFLINEFREPIARISKQKFEIGGNGFSRYDDKRFQTANNNFVSFCMKYAFIYQVRIYSEFNKLIRKLDYQNIDSAIEKLNASMDLEGAYRGVLRVNNPFYMDWVILFTVTTENLTYYDSAPRKWRYTYYGADDYIIFEEIKDQGWDFASITTSCEQHNAYYVCISFWDDKANGGAGGFLIDEFFSNGNYIDEHRFIDDVLDLLLQYRSTKKDELYKDLIERDERESLELNL